MAQAAASPTPSALAVVTGNRRFMYLYLARAFSKAPAADLLELVETARPQCELLDDERHLGRDAQQHIEDAASALGDGCLEVLSSDYMHLFVGPNELPVPPWESVLTSPEGLLFRDSTLEVRGTYRRAGYQAAGYPHEADDHLGTELHFMAELAGRLDSDLAAAASDPEAAAALGDLLQTQAAFCHDHLANWVGRFAELLGQTAEDQSGFYPAFAALARIHVERDLEVMAELRELLEGSDGTGAEL